MSAYMIVDVDVHDADVFQEYQKRVPTLIKKHGGEYIVRGGEFEVIEGSWQPHRLVLFRFPDRQAIRAFLDDPEYAEWKALRHRTCDSVLVAVDGVG
jgi:uncharacterized protein (DUF1330 family)